jgi:hypothetical protein
LVPFLIDWGTTRHPAESDLPLVGLVSLTIGHPSPEPVRKDLTAIGMSLPQAEVALADDSARTSPPCCPGGTVT